MRVPKGYISIGILVALLFLSGALYVSSPVVERIEASLPVRAAREPEETSPAYAGKHVVVNLGEMKVSLREGTSTLETMPILSIGKPGSYYETIGGAHIADYKIRRHFSSIGHVYMPWSTHVFGNFFIHGIPYYEDGTKVSSTYSGGCVRLTDEDAKKVFDFVEKGVPIIVTSSDERQFQPTDASEVTLTSIDLTRFMVATVSLEVLAQDSDIRDADGAITTRRKLLPRLIVGGDDEVSRTLAKSLGEETFMEYMNQKAQALGMSGTHFTSLTDPVRTTPDDTERFRRYITEYKTYLVTLSTATQTPSQ